MEAGGEVAPDALVHDFSELQPTIAQKTTNRANHGAMQPNCRPSLGSWMAGAASLTAGPCCSPSSRAASRSDAEMTGPAEAAAAKE